MTSALNPAPDAVARRTPIIVTACLLPLAACLMLLWWLKSGSVEPGNDRALSEAMAHQAALRQSIQDAQPGNPTTCPPGQSLGPTASASGPASGDAQTLTDPQITAKLEAATAIVLVITAKDGLGMGTGFFVRQDHILTNRHVIEGAEGAEVLVTSRALGALRKATIVGATQHSQAGSPDFALLRLEQPAPPSVIPLEFGPEPPKLAPVIAAGYPAQVAMADADFGRLLRGDPTAAPDLSLTRGTVQSLQEGNQRTPMLIHTANISRGNSGGPLVDQCARAVGTNTFLLVDSEQSSKSQYAISSRAALEFLASIGSPAQTDPRPCAQSR
jgi:serine protease Do